MVSKTSEKRWVLRRDLKQCIVVLGGILRTESSERGNGEDSGVCEAGKPKVEGRNGKDMRGRERQGHGGLKGKDQERVWIWECIGKQQRGLIDVVGAMERLNFHSRVLGGGEGITMSQWKTSK